MKRMPAIGKMGTTIAEEIRLNSDRQLDQVEAAMVAARDHRPSEDETARLAGLATRLSDLLKVAVPANRRSRIPRDSMTGGTAAWMRSTDEVAKMLWRSF